MTVPEMTKEELLAQLTELRTRVAELERLESGRSEEIEVLQQRSSMLQSLLYCSPDPMVVYDAEGRVLFLNAAFAATFGWSNEELQGQRIDYVPEDLLAETGEKLERRFKGEHVPPYDTRRLTRDGRILDVHISSAFFTNSLGQPLGHIVTLRDITEKKRTERALRESEQKYRFLAEHMNDILWTVDLNMRTTFVSPSIERLLGFTPEERMQQGVETQLTPESFTRAQQRLLEELIREREQGIRLHESVDLELDYRHKNGSIVCLESVMKFIRDEMGTPIGVHGLSRDVTARKKAEEAFRHAQERLESIFRAAPAGIGLVENRVIREANEFLCQMTGYSKEELKNADARLLYSTEEEYEFVGKEKYGQIEKDGTGTVETRWKRKDGEVINIILSSSPVDQRDRSKGVTFTAIDITNRKKAEDALRESEAKYRLLVDNVNDAIFVAQDGFLKSPNHRLALMTGYRLNELVEQPFTKFVHPEDAQMVLDRHRQRVDGASEASSKYQFRVLRKDGNLLWVELSVTLSEWEGRPATLNVLRDVTERKRAEEALRESEEKYRSVFDNAAVGINLKSPDGIFLEVNQTLINMLGYSRDELNGLSYLAITHPDDVQLSREMHAALERGDINTYRIEKRYISKDGRVVCVDTSVVALRDSFRKVQATVGIIADTTERKKAEEALRKSEEFNRRLVEHAPLGIAYLAGDGTIEFVNPTANRIMGVPEGQMTPVLGRNIFELPGLQDRPEIQENFRRFKKGESLSDLEVPYKSAMGRDTVLLVAATPRFGSDGTVAGG